MGIIFRTVFELGRQFVVFPLVFNYESEEAPQFVIPEVVWLSECQQWKMDN